MRRLLDPQVSKHSGFIGLQGFRIPPKSELGARERPIASQEIEALVPSSLSLTVHFLVAHRDAIHPDAVQ